MFLGCVFTLEALEWLKWKKKCDEVLLDSDFDKRITGRRSKLLVRLNNNTSRLLLNTSTEYTGFWKAGIPVIVLNHILDPDKVSQFQSQTFDFFPRTSVSLLPRP